MALSATLLLLFGGSIIGALSAPTSPRADVILEDFGQPKHKWGEVKITTK